jgi:WD40 repeat protein
MAEGKQRSEDEESEQGDDEEFAIKDIKPKQWVTPTMQETEADIISSNKGYARAPLRIRVARKRRDFAQSAAKFTPNDTQAMDIRPKIEPNYKADNERQVLEIGLQAGKGIKLFPQPKGQGFQSVFFRTINASTEYSQKDILDYYSKFVPRTVDITENPNLDTFIRNIEVRMEQALQSNETIDVFKDEFLVLGDEEGGENKVANAVREQRTFLSLEFTKHKTISDIQWQPNTDSVIAASCVENINFEERVSRSGKSAVGNIVVWSFSEFSNILLIMKAPSEINCFLFNPSNTKLVIGGLLTGQIAIWDSDLQHDKTRVDLMKQQDKVLEISPLCITQITESHRAPVVAVSWLPKRVKIERKNPCVVYPEPLASTQLMSLSEDGQLMFWESSFPPDKNPYKMSDFVWLPLLKFQLHKPDTHGEIGGSRLLVHADQEDSVIWAASDTGDIMQIEWASRTMEETSAEHVKIILNSEMSYRAVIELRRSPFYNDILMTVHDFNFCIWKEGCDEPIFTSYYSTAYMTCGDFSPTRPGVIIIGRSDGRLDIWDFSDQSHKESINYSIASDRLSVLRFLPVRRSPQLVAIGDSTGVVHILEIPRNLAKGPDSEKRLIYEFWEREEQRVFYFAKRFEIRQEEARRREMQAMQDS